MLRWPLALLLLGLAAACGGADPATDQVSNFQRDRCSRGGCIPRRAAHAACRRRRGDRASGPD